MSNVGVHHGCPCLQVSRQLPDARRTAGGPELRSGHRQQFGLRVTHQAAGFPIDAQDLERLGVDDQNAVGHRIVDRLQLGPAVAQRLGRLLVFLDLCLEIGRSVGNRVLQTHLGRLQFGNQHRGGNENGQGYPGIQRGQNQLLGIERKDIEGRPGRRAQDGQEEPACPPHIPRRQGNGQDINETHANIEAIEGVDRPDDRDHQDTADQDRHLMPPAVRVFPIGRHSGFRPAPRQADGRSVR